jgi:hypothetical protein
MYTLTLKPIPNPNPRPVQRIPRYELLITELKKNTTPNHADYTSLEEAQQNIQIIAKSINESKKQAENREKILSIQGALEGYSVSPFVDDVIMTL